MNANPTAIKTITTAIEAWVDKLPENTRNELLFKLAENEETAEGIAGAIYDNFMKIVHKQK